MSYSNSNGPGAGCSIGNGASGPHVLTATGVPLNPVPEIWVGATPRGTL